MATLRRNEFHTEKLKRRSREEIPSLQKKENGLDVILREGLCKFCGATYEEQTEGHENGIWCCDAKNEEVKKNSVRR